MKIQGIYSIQHVASGRFYVGSAVDITARWHIHRHHLRTNAHHSPHLQAAWERDGPDAFLFRAVEEVPNKADLLAREQWWIDELNALFGFNCCPVAGSPLGTKHTDASKAKMRAAKLGKPAPWNARKHTAEQNERHSAALTGRKRATMTADTKGKIGAANLGKKHSVDAIRKLSEAWDRRREDGVSEHTRSKLSASLAGNKNSLGNVISEDTRAKLKASQAARRLREKAAVSHSPHPDQGATSPAQPPHALP